MTRISYEIIDGWHTSKPILTDLGMCLARYNGMVWRIEDAVTRDVLQEKVAEKPSSVRRELKAAIIRIGAYFDPDPRYTVRKIQDE